MTEKNFKYIADNLDPKWVPPNITVHPVVLPNDITQALSEKYSMLNGDIKNIEQAKVAIIVAINKSKESNLQTNPAFKVVPGSHYRDIRIEKLEQPKATTWTKKQQNLIPIVCFITALLLMATRAQ